MIFALLSGGLSFFAKITAKTRKEREDDFVGFHYNGLITRSKALRGEGARTGKARP